MWFSLTIALANLAWGLTRWILRWRREHWRPGQVVGKLIGGGIWRTFAAMPFVLLSLFSLAPLTARAVSAAALDRTIPGSDVLLASAYSAGEINADTYLTYLLDATYDTTTLPSEYQSPDPLITPDFLTFIDEHFDELSPDLIESTLETISLSHLDFDTDASGNLSSSSSPFVQNAYATTTKVTTLNKAYLSARKNFVIFYTDTGDDAITELQAAKISNMLETIIANYSSILGLDYEYQLYPMSSSKAKKMGKVLEASHIDKDITQTAMAVYIANPYKPNGDNANTLATYAGRKFSEGFISAALKLAELFGEENSKFYNSAPAYPFINILPSNLSDSSLELVTAHELGHHYSSNYCYATTGKACNDNYFVGETAANWFAINVVPNQPTGNLIQSNHHKKYIRAGTCYTIDQTIPEPPAEHACHDGGSFTGYPAVAFLQNYSEIVPNSTNIILWALTVDNALQYLYDAAPGYFQKVMTSLTERNLTNDYGDKISLYATELPRGEEIPCTDICTASYYIAPASSRYLYFPTTDYKNVALSVSAPGNVTISLLGQKHDTWTVLSSTENTAEFTIPEDAEYDTYAFALANYSITEASNFSLNITAAPLEEIVAEDEPTAFDPSGLPIAQISDSCFGFNFDSIIDLPLQIYRALSELDPDHDYSEVFAELEAQNNQIKNSLTYHYATICITDLKPGLDFNSARNILRHSINHNIEFFSIDSSDLRLSMFVSYNVFRLEGRFYFLLQADASTGLITARMYEKSPVN